MPGQSAHCTNKESATLVARNQEGLFFRTGSHSIFRILAGAMFLLLLLLSNTAATAAISSAESATSTSKVVFRSTPSQRELNLAIARTEQYLNQLYKPVDGQNATVGEYYDIPLRVYLTRYQRWILLGENSRFCSHFCFPTSSIYNVVNRESSETFVAEFRSPQYSNAPQILVDVNWNYDAQHYQIKLINEHFDDQSTMARVYLYDLYIGTFSSSNLGQTHIITFDKTDITQLHSFRYTIRHGNQLAQNYYWYKQDLDKYQRLARFLVQQGYQLDYDIYAPMWGYGTLYPDDLPFHISGGDGNEAYHDCHASSWNNNFNYQYQSKVCKVGPSIYVTISRGDLLTVSIQAMHILNKYGDPERSYSDGGNQQYTPLSAAIELEQKFDKSGIGIPMCSMPGCNYGMASGVRTFSFGAFETMLGYQYGRRESQAYADTVARLALQVQVGDNDTLQMANGGTFYRPAQRGAFYLSWNASMRYIQDKPFGYQYINDMLNMPDEYQGVLVSDMETTFNAYAFLVLYRCNKYGIGCASKTPKPLTAALSGANSVHITKTYSGTMYNVPMDVTTHLSLRKIQQDNNAFLGSFTGTQVNGRQVNELISGIIDTHRRIRFTVTEYAGQIVLSFDGSLEANGSIGGNYCSVDQQEQCTGEYGIWSLNPIATG